MRLILPANSLIPWREDLIRLVQTSKWCVPTRKPKYSRTFYWLETCCSAQSKTLFSALPSLRNIVLGEQDQVNDDWAAADREYQAASLTLETDRRVLEGAKAGGKKNRIADAERQTAEAQKKVMEALAKRDALPHFRHVSTEQPYTYTEATHPLKATVELGFVIQDTSERVIVPTVTIPETQEQTYVVLENVKPDDIMGVRPQGEVPTSTQFLEKVGNAARDLLLAQAKEKVIGLPPLILQTADRKVAESDNDGAAELYMLYLNSTGPEPTPERKKAQKFLLDTYNFKAYGDPPKS